MNRDVELRFNEFVVLSPAEREAYFRQRTVEPGPRKEVETLLRFDTRADHGITESVADVAGEWVAQAANPNRKRIVLS